VVNELKKLTFHLEPGMWHGSAAETVWVEPVGDNHYRLENSPFYAFGISYQDVVSAKSEGGLLVFDSVVSRGGHSTYRVIRQDSAAFEEFWLPLQELGCTYEEGPNNLIAVDVPPSADIYQAYALLSRGEEAGAWTFQEGHCGHALKVGGT
jgi:hypothetical protein